MEEAEELEEKSEHQTNEGRKEGGNLGLKNFEKGRRLRYWYGKVPGCTLCRGKGKGMVGW